MDSIYTYCAAIGGVLVVLQTAASLVGFGGSDLDGLDSPDLDVDLDVDADLDVDSDIDVADGAGDAWFVGMLSTRAILAAIAVFGLTGITLRSQLSPMQTMLSALLAAAATMYAVGLVIRGMHKLVSDGSVRIEDTLGQPGTVYLGLAAKHGSVGKVTVTVAERTMEYPAVTAGEELTTGTPIVVVNVVGDTLEVAGASTAEQDLAQAGSM